MSVDVGEYCRQIETYLCQKSDGHLIRVVGPSFDLVSRWAHDGVPFKVACHGIDRYFERYYRNGPKRRPVRIDFCEADVLDAFDEWRRATGVRTGDMPDGSATAAPSPRGGSLPEHLTRVLTRLTQARLAETLDASADRVIDAISRDLDQAKASGHGVRGAARTALLERLSAADDEMMAIARRAVSPERLGELRREAEGELSSFRAQMTPDAFEQARTRAVDRLLRDQLRLPTIAFS